jgi:hypothetical protein
MNTAQPALLYLVPCLLLSTILTSLYRRELKEIYTGKRIQTLLDGKTQKLTSPLNNGVDNLIGQSTHDEIPQNDMVIDINDRTGVDNH